MAIDANDAKRRYLIVTKHVIVAEDLREILGAGGHVSVDWNSSLKDEWTAPYDAAFFSSPFETILDDPRIKDLQMSGTHVVAMNGDMPLADDTDNGVVTLDLPFTSEDVDQLLRGLGIDTAGRSE